jgi:hypothetical protein
MRVLLLLCSGFVFSLGIFAQGTVKNLQPQLGPVPDLSAEADKGFARRDILLNKGSLETDEQKELDGLLEKYPETLENKWQVLGGDCSWYCGEGPYKYTASSSLGENYKSDNIHDLNFQYAWVEGAKGNGIGESVTYYFKNKAPRLHTIIVYNGYLKTDETWQNNGRVKKLKLLVNNIPYAILNLADSKAEQKFKVPLLGHRKDGKDLILKFQIMEVYPGKKYEDVAITEIYFDGIDVH